MDFLIYHWHCILPVIGIIGYIVFMGFTKNKEADTDNESDFYADINNHTKQRESDI